MIFRTHIPCVVYFGLKNTSPFFQRIITHKFQPLMQKYEPYLSNYLNNWIIAMPGGNKGLTLHQRIMHEFLDLLQKLSYFLKLGKCEFEQPTEEFLRWLITSDGITMDPSKAEGLA